MKKIYLVLFLLSWFCVLHAKQASEAVTVYLSERDTFRIAGFVMAKELGYYKEAGLDVSFSFEPNSQVRTEKVLQATNRYGVGSFSMIHAIMKNRNIVLIGSLLQQTPLVLLTKKSTTSSDRLDALHGKKVMIKNQEEEDFLRLMLKSAKMGLEDIIRVKGDNALLALDQKVVDAAVIDRTATFLTQEYPLRSYALYEPIKQGLELYDDLLFTSHAHLNSQSKQTEAFYKASMRGWEYAFKHSYQTASYMSAYGALANRDPLALVNQAELLKSYVVSKNGHFGSVDGSKIEKMMQLLRFDDRPKIDVKPLLYEEGALKAKPLLSSSDKKDISQQTAITFCVDRNMMPIETLKDGIHKGILADINYEISKHTKIQFRTFAVDTPKEKLAAQKRGLCDIYAGPRLAEDTNDTSTALLSMPFAFITQSQERFYFQFSEISQKRVAVVRGDTLLPILRRTYKGLKIIEVDTARQGLIAVSKGDVFAFVGLLPVCSYYINNQGLSNLKVAGHMDIDMPIKYTFSSNAAYLRPFFDKAISSIDDAEKHKIIKKWVEVEYEPGVDYAIFVFMMLVALSVIAIVVYFNYRLRIKVDKAVKERRLQEQMLLQQSKLASIGEMIGNIAHQWRQPLMGLSALMMEIEAKIQSQGSISNEDLHNIVERANKTMRFMSTTINDFWSFFSKDKEAVSFKPKDVIDTTLNIIDATLKKSGVAIRVKEYAPCRVFGYKNEFSQAVINIVSNAKDILTERNIIDPRLTITIENEDNQCKISFEDNAGGIKVEPIDRIFEPFVSVRQIASSGLGLCMTKNIIEKSMGGTLIVENREEGAQFVMYIPSDQGSMS